MPKHEKHDLINIQLILDYSYLIIFLEPLNADR
jgi:hypothetical protein